MNVNRTDSIKRTSDFLLKGWRLLNTNCPICNTALLSHGDKLFCPGCNLDVLVETKIDKEGHKLI